MYRILAEDHPVRERRDQLTHPAYTKPELVATAPTRDGRGTSPGRSDRRSGRTTASTS